MTAMIRAFDALRIDRWAREVTVDGRVVNLTVREFDLLAFLAQSPRQVFTRGQLLEGAWDRQRDSDPTAVTACVRRLRRKIESATTPRQIHTVRGVGYTFDG